MSTPKRAGLTSSGVAKVLSTMRLHPVSPGDLDQRGNVGDAHQRVGDRLEEEHARTHLRQYSLHRVQVADVDVRRPHAEGAEDISQQRLGGAVEIAAGHDPVARLDLIQDRRQQRRHAGAEGDRVLRLFQRRDRDFERTGRGVAVPGVDVPLLLAAEDRILRLRVVGQVRHRRVDRRHRRRELRPLRALPGVHRSRGEPAQYPAYVAFFSLCQTLLQADRRISPRGTMPRIRADARAGPSEYATPRDPRPGHRAEAPPPRSVEERLRSPRSRGGKQGLGMRGF